MPQMAPMLWVGLFLYFILLTAILMKLVFFEIFYYIDKSDNKNKFIAFNWKW